MVDEPLNSSRPRLPSRPPWSPILAAAGLAALVLAVFLPVLDFEFIEYDVDGQVLKNPRVRGLTAENLAEIATSRSMTSYYPVRTFTFAVDYQLWGLNPRGFKLTNVLIHLANTLLLFGLIQRMSHWRRGLAEPWLVGGEAKAGSGGAANARDRDGFFAGSGWLWAAVFAVHPVVVEPVTWVAGREELLMVLGGLCCFHFHLSARQRSATGGPALAGLGFRIASVVACAAACLSNAAAAVIPLLITAWDLVAIEPPSLRQVVRAGWPLWLIGAATIALKKLGPETALLTGYPAVLSAERLMLVLEVFGRNLATLFWPRDLAIVYANDFPRSFLDPPVLLGGLAAVLAVALLVAARRQRLVLFGLVWFVLALAPSAQIMPHHWLRADRFLYLPLAGLVLAGAAWIRGARLRGGDGRAVRLGTAAAGVLILLLLCRVSLRQIETWRSNVSLWEHCVRVSPRSPVAHGALADALTKAGQFGRAVPHYRIALQLDPDNPETLNNFALELAANDDPRLRDYDLAVSLAWRGCEVAGWQSPKLRRTLAMALNNYGLELESRREYRRAAQCYVEAGQVDAGYEAPLFNLALLLATCSDASLRRAAEAVQVAERACQIVEYRDPNGLFILATAYAQAGQAERAATAMQRAIRAARATGNQQLAEQLQASANLPQDPL